MRKGDDGEERGKCTPQQSPSQYFGDKQLLYRVRQYVQSSRMGLPALPRSKAVISTMAEDLQQQYGEYARRKQKPFQKLVEKAYGIIMAEETGERTPSGAPVDNQQRRAKKRRYSQSSDSSLDLSETEAAQKKPPNLLNKMVCDMYKRNAGKAAAKPASEPAPEVPPCGWFIDTDVHSSSRHTGSQEPVKSQGSEKHSTRSGGAAVSGTAKARSQMESLDLDCTGSIASLTKTPVPQSEDGHCSQAGHQNKGESEEARHRGEMETKRTPEEEMEVEREVMHTSGTPQAAKPHSAKTSKKSAQRKAERRILKKALENAFDGEEAIPVPTLEFKDFAGIERFKSMLEYFSLEFLDWARVRETPGTPGRVVDLMAQRSTKGLLLSGPAGSGKTHLVRCLAGELGVKLLEVPAEKLVAGISGESEENISATIKLALDNQPCIVLLSGLEGITSRYGSNTTAMTDRIICALGTSITGIPADARVLVVGETCYPEKVAQDLRKPSCFGEELEMNIPDEHTRREILKVLLKEYPLAEDVDVTWLARATPGYTGSDLSKLCRKALYSVATELFLVPEAGGDGGGKPRRPISDFSAMDPKDLPIRVQDFEAAMKVVQPTTKAGFPMVPAETWEQIGGLRGVVTAIRKAVLRPVFCRDSLFHKTNILLVGPPGCGKTLIAKALANEANINFLPISGPELKNKYVGASEENLRTAFRRARNAAPCILFFDEIDSLCTKHDEQREGSNSGILGTFLTELDGVMQRNSQVILMAATNRPHVLDPALMRAGRIDKKIFIGLPDEEARLDIIKRVLKKMSSRKTTVELAEDVDLGDIARKCQNFSGAELTGMVREAVEQAVDSLEGSDVEDFTKLSHISSVTVHKAHFEQAVRTTQLCLTERELKMYADMQRRYTAGQL